MECRDTLDGRGAARVGCDHARADGGEQARGFRADTAEANDQRRCRGQINNAGIERLRLPEAINLLRKIGVEIASEGKDEGEDVGADMVVVYLAHVRHCDRMGDERGIVIAGGRRGLRCLEPAEILRACEEMRRQHAIGASALAMTCMASASLSATTT